MKKILLALALSLFASNAYAVCSQIPLNVKDASNNTVAMSSASAGDGNCKTYIDADTSSQIHTDLAAINTTAGAAIPSQSPAVPVGGIGICDGANGTTNPCTTAATVKAASTAATATDKALVVAISPNNTPTVTPVPTAGQGCTPYHLAGGTGASTNANVVKASAGTLCHLSVISTSATLAYLKLYNLTSATCSSATGIVHVIPIPASAAGAGFVVPLPMGEAYGTGISYCVTGGGGDTDNTNATTGIFIEGSYK